jgi:hypothetical protein
MSSGKPHGRRRTARGQSSPPTVPAVRRTSKSILQPTAASSPSTKPRAPGTPAGLDALPRPRSIRPDWRTRARWRQASSTGSSRAAGETPWPAAAGAVRRFSARSSGVARSFEWKPIDRAVPSPCATGALHVDRRLRRRGGGCGPASTTGARDVQRSPRFTARGTADGHSCGRWAGVRAVGRQMVTPKNCRMQKARSLRSSPVYKDGLEPDGPYHRLIAARCDKSVAAARSGLFCALRSRTATWTSASPGAECAWTPAHALFPFGHSKRPRRDRARREDSARADSRATRQITARDGRLDGPAFGHMGPQMPGHW